MGAIVLEGRSESNGDRSGQENKKENRSPRIYQGRREGIASPFESENAPGQDSEADQKNGRFIASEGTQAWHQPRSLEITARHPISGTSVCVRNLLKERCGIATYLGAVVGRDAAYGFRVPQPEFQ